MSNKPDGGPAFPFTPHPQQELQNGTWDQSYDPGESGMTLRDWFAGMALQGILSNDTPYEKAAATEAYNYADAMLAERVKGTADE